MVKVSQLPQDTLPTTTDYIMVLDTETMTLKKVLVSDLVPTNTASTPNDYVYSGGVWSGDAYASTRNASMTAIVCYINGRRVAVSAVSARSFTASKDTYVDVLDNGDGTGTLVYTEVSNNATSPALASSSIRIGIIVTGASNIANVGSINQGEEDKILPLVSSVAYSVVDGLGNLICPRDPTRKILGFRRIISGASQTSASDTQVTGLTCPVIVPANRKIIIVFDCESTVQTVSDGEAFVTMWDGAVGSTKVGAGYQVKRTAGSQSMGGIHFECEPASVATGLKTYNVGLARGAAGGTATISAGATTPCIMRIMLA